MTTRPRILPALLVVAVLVLGACSGDDDSTNVRTDGSAGEARPEGSNGPDGPDEAPAGGGEGAGEQGGEGPTGEGGVDGPAGTESGPGGDGDEIDAAAARAGLDAFIAFGEAERDDDYPAVTVDRCAFGPHAEFAGIVAEVVPINDGARTAEFTHAWVNPDAPGGTGCQSYERVETPIGIYEVEVYAAVLDEGGYDPTAGRNERWERTDETVEPWAGGELRSFCWDLVVGGVDRDCAAHWVHEDTGFAIELLLSTNDASPTAEQARTGMQAVLPHLAQQLAANA